MIWIAIIKLPPKYDLSSQNSLICSNIPEITLISRCYLVIQHFQQKPSEESIFLLMRRTVNQKSTRYVIPTLFFSPKLREVCSLAAENIFLLEEISIKGNKSSTVNKRRDSSNFRNIASKIHHVSPFFLFRSILLCQEDSSKDKIVFFST